MASSYETNPYQSGDSQDTRPPKKRNWFLIIMSGIGILSVITVLACCGGGYGIFYFSMNFIADAVKSDVQDDPSIQQHIGDIESLSINMEETSEVQIDEGKRTYAFDIEGTKGSGQLIAKVVEQGGDEIGVESGRLIVDGEEYPLER